MSTLKQLFNDRYEKLAQIGEGSYGEVYLVRDIKLKEQNSDENSQNKEVKIALKKSKDLNQSIGIDFTTLREVKILKEIRHDNIIKLYDTFFTENNFFMAMEYCPCNINELMNQRHLLSNAMKVQIIKQILQGINFLHEMWIMHRDIKPANVMISFDGKMKLIDFGMAKLYGQPDKLLSMNVQTLNYRAPEVLFGSMHYGPKIDIWSAGCIFVELYLEYENYQKSALFEGISELNVLQQIFKLRGTPTEQDWPNCSFLKNYKQFEPSEPFPIQRLVPGLSREGCELAELMLQLDPNKRIFASDALKHPFFAESESETTGFIEEEKKATEISQIINTIYKEKCKILKIPEENIEDESEDLKIIF